MSFSVKTFEPIRDAILRDIANQNPQAAVGADSDYRVRANASAAAIEGLYQHQAWIARQILPDTADDDMVLQHALRYGMTPKVATFATGSITLSGAPGAAVGIGVECKALDGRIYVTTAAGIIGADAMVTLAAQASATGLAGNQAAGTSVTLTSAPPGVSSTAVIVNMSTGTDVESIASILARLLDRLRHPPAGGNQYDYRRWALEVPGVTQAYCYPLRRGLGTTDVAILSNGVPATLALQNSVKAYIESVNPAGGDCRVLTPTLVPVNVDASTVLAGITLADLVKTVRAVLAAYIAGMKPGDTVARARLMASITDVPGVIDVTLNNPTSSVVTVVDATRVELPTLGTVVLS